MSSWKEVIEKLETGELRSAEKIDGKWKVVFGQRSSGRNPNVEMPSFQ